MNESIAIVGMACRYPEAKTPGELWENVLAQRRAFRRLPPERLSVPDYYSPDRRAPDHTYSVQAALLEGFEFDRVRFRVVGSTFRSADMTHWLALTVAADALADAGFPDGSGLPRETTGVLLGNSLAGEFSRAGLMRHRWPYVRRTLAAALDQAGWSVDQRRSFLENFEVRYKEPFPPVGDESLAGGLANTIAGRICNQFDLKGGGYTVDGACASSLLAVATACSSLAAGDTDVALAGGVDLSLDPFELVGFAKLGALAEDEMRVYDVRPAGFWPGEGCGCLVLMRHEDALAQGRRIYAVLRGWGVSSDGRGGITRPEEEGQRFALERAYRRAGFGIDTVAYFEGHGTGTTVGDLTELRTLGGARRGAAPAAPPAVIGSVKANIGHTKAAAGAAGLIKATMAVHTQVLPPTTGCEQPHPELAGDMPALRILREPEPWPADLPLRAAVSAMGFGGINTHVVLEGPAAQRRRGLTPRERVLRDSPQDAEVFLLSGTDRSDLGQQTKHLLGLAQRLSRSELADLAATLAAQPVRTEIRAALVAGRPAELEEGLHLLTGWLEEGISERLDFDAGVFLGSQTAQSRRIGFLFPGQGSPSARDGGLFRRRFESVRELYGRASLPAEGDPVATAVAQPAIVTASLAGLRVLREFGITGSVAVGHSLGELTALHWAGVWDETAVVRVAAARGKAMSELGHPTGAMAGLEADAAQVRGLLNGERISIAGLNSPRQTVISGDIQEVACVVDRAQRLGWRTVRLPVSHAFHSPLVAAAVPALAETLAEETLAALQRPLSSTITGTILGPAEDLRQLLCRQVTAPVRFMEAVLAADSAATDENRQGGVDLWIEVGPGRVLSGLVREIVQTPVVSLDVGGASLRGLGLALGACFVTGALLRPAALFNGRFTRPFDLAWQPRFLVNPCELAPPPDGSAPPMANATATAHVQLAENDRARLDSAFKRPPAATPAAPVLVELPATIELVRQLVAERAELPLCAVQDESNLLNDLHLNSISVGQVVAEAARRLDLTPPVAPTDFANATVAAVARALDELARTGSSAGGAGSQAPPPGVDSWIRPFVVEWVEQRRPARRAAPIGQGWTLVADPGHPLASALQAALVGQPGGGVVVCLSQAPLERQIHLLLQGARLLAKAQDKGTFVLVQPGAGAGGFARTVHLELGVPTCVVVVPFTHPQAAAWVLAELALGNGYVEAHYDAAGSRREPRLRLLTLDENTASAPLERGDVLLVSGGGKGIAAECALALARQAGLRLVILGRSHPDEDRELELNLQRLAEAGVTYRYLPADVTDAEAVRQAVAAAQVELGPVRGVLHGAGTNVPQLLASLDEAAFRRTLLPKLEGARNLLAALDPSQLRLWISFGSIIARMGLRGEADYAVANESLAAWTEALQQAQPKCRCLTLEWSVWSGVGMGQRLGRVDALLREGITPISPEQGVEILCRLVRQPLPASAVVVGGRFGEPDTLVLDKPDVPLHRFLEQIRVFYPGVEMVVEATLSPGTDPYVEDHSLHGERLFPAVMGLEAMARLAMTLAESDRPPSFEDVQWHRPVVVPKNGLTRIRLAGLVRPGGEVDVVLRSEETGFQTDHFRARCRFDGGLGETERRDTAAWRSPRLPLDMDQDIYKRLLFHEGRFRRVRNYRLLRARECVAQLEPDGEVSWFGPYLPQDRVLGDTGVRDAAIHAIQACIPHARLLPVGVERIHIGRLPCLLRSSRLEGRPPVLLLRACERAHQGDIFHYDLELMTEDGLVLERWENLRLRRVEPITHEAPWPPALLGNYLERCLDQVFPQDRLALVLHQPSPLDGAAPTPAALARLGVSVRYRPDGKPELGSGMGVSAAHADHLTLAVAGSSSVGCDLEPVQARQPESWQDLLGPERFRLAGVVATAVRESLDVSATRVWCASECLKKTGSAPDAPLVFAEKREDHCVLLRSGNLMIATWLETVAGLCQPLVIGVLGPHSVSGACGPINPGPRPTQERRLQAATGQGRGGLPP